MVESSLRRLDRDEREMKHHKEEVTQQINAHYDVLMTWARRSRDELLEKVSAKGDLVRRQLHAETVSYTHLTLPTKVRV